MTIGQRIKARRKDLKISVDELAARLGKDRSTVYRYEKGDIENMPLDILKPIADALDTSVSYIMGWEGEDKKEKPTVKDDGHTEMQLKLMKLAEGLSDDQIEALIQMSQAFLGRK